ncbi:MAG: HAMP domain-containing histidine kinase [Oscillospiraceae bacterium]|nr:HAMP domain-containing histidine kinase [Oscillospiraceae bacterium]
MKKKKTTAWGMLFLFAAVVFIALWAHMAIAASALFVLNQLGIITLPAAVVEDVRSLIFIVATISVPIGVLVAFLFSKVPLKPIRELITSMDALASGDFHTRVSVGPIMKKYPAFVEVSESFNKMAEHLESTEMLRSDFINNLSHEFKTPIVSIAGFAKLLRRGNLTPEQQQEYLAIIEEESLRLSYMATNVLNLTKVENQTILTDVSEYNLSEQLRSCILLLENKWSKKDLEFNLRLDEHRIHANEELMKQVWINLIENAVKFSPQEGLIEVSITEMNRAVCVTIHNTGDPIPTDRQAKIWNKFYQADESHATEGNGVGLAIVKRIVELHGGKTAVKSTKTGTTFTVTLPK